MDDKPATGNRSAVTTTTASMETTMELPTIGIHYIYRIACLSILQFKMEGHSNRNLA